MLPSIFGENLFDEFFDDAFDRRLWNGSNALYGKHARNLMKTDVQENESGYTLSIDLPGFKKDEVNVELKDGYLTITADRKEPVEKADDRTRYVRKERYYGTMKRTFYVGEDITENEIHAAFKDGILKVIIDKPQPKKIEEEKTIIPIEG